MKTTVHIALVLITLLVLPLVVAEPSRVFVLGLHYDRVDGVSLTDLYVKGGVPTLSHPNTADAYRYEVISFDNEVLAEGYFLIQTEVHLLPALSSAAEEHLELYDVSEEEVAADDAKLEEVPLDTDVHAEDEVLGEHILLDEVDLVLRVPYFANAQHIVVYSPTDEKIVTAPVVQFADTCGNALCESHESFERCSSDCPSGQTDGYCDRVVDSICDADCHAADDPDCTVEKSEQQLAYESKFVCNNNGVCEQSENQNNCAADCGDPPRGFSGFVMALVVIALLFVALKFARAAKKKE